MTNNPLSFLPKGRDGTAGMTLRDWFAGQALIEWSKNGFETSVIAKKCFALADAMIAERAK